MKPGSKRFYDSLFGRTALVLILTLILSHAAAFGLFSWAFRDGPIQLWAKRIAAEVDTQRGIWQVLTPAEREAYLHGHDGRGDQLREQAPAHLQTLQADPQGQELVAELKQLLGDDIRIGRTPPPHAALWLRVLVGGRWLWLKHSQQERGPGPGYGPAGASQPPPEFGLGPGSRAPFDESPPPPGPADRAEPGGPGWQEPAPPPAPRPDTGLTLALILASAGIGLLGTLALLWPLYRPLRRLSEAQAALGRGETVDSLPTQGPYEVAQLTSGFNHMKDSLDALEDERRTLLAGVSHDLRTPLTRLRMRLALLDEVDTAPYERDLDDIQHITEQFLAYVRGEADEAPRQAVDIGQLLQELAEGYRPICPIQVQAEAGLTALIDKLAISRALGNLIDNALAHGQPPLVLSANRDGHYLLLSLRDHGPGMPEVELQAARRPFHRLDPARQGRGHCGLGLAIAQRVAQRHGGQLRLSNAATGGLLACIRIQTDPLPA